MKTSVSIAVIATVIFSANGELRAQGAWGTKPAMPDGRYGSGAGAINSTLVSGGGGPTAGGNIGTTEIYDLTNDMWSTGADMPTAVSFPASVVYSGKLYVFGGDTIVSGTKTPSNRVQIYDPGTNSWTNGANMPIARTASTAGVLDGKIYVADGATSSGATNIVQVYDPVTDMWSSATSAPTARFFVSGATFDNQFLVAGGGALEAFAAGLKINDSVTGTGKNQWDYDPSWSTPAIASAYHGDAHVSSTTDAMAHFRFSGIQIQIFTVTEPDGGFIGFSLDGGAEELVSNYSATTQGNSATYLSPTLSYGDHDVVVRVVGSHESTSTGNTVTVDRADVNPATNPTPPPDQYLACTVNDSDTGSGNEEWDYDANWGSAPVSGAYQNDEHYAFATNATAHFRFHGTQV